MKINIKDYFASELFSLNWNAEDKEALFLEISQFLKKHDYLENVATALELMKARENLVSTELPNGIAIPHFQLPALKKDLILYVPLKKAILWNAQAKVFIKHVFLIALKNHDHKQVSILSALSKKFLASDFLLKLEKIKDHQALVALFSEPAERAQSFDHLDKITRTKYDIVAVTACPTGIAHTYLAAETLEKAAQALNLTIKVERQSSQGVDNPLSAQEIKAAQGVLLAIDRNIDLKRFAQHTNILETTTKKAIYKTEELLKSLVKQKGAKITNITSSSENHQLNYDLQPKRFFKSSLKSVVNGISYMLPFVIFGGILIALSFLIDINNANQGDQFGKTNDIAYWFNRLGGLSFGLLNLILAAYIAYGLAGKAGLLPGFVTGIIASGSFDFRGFGWFGTPNQPSGFFGAILGGIYSGLILLLIFKYLNPKMPKSLRGIHQILFIPFFGTLFIAASFWIINLPIVYLNQGFHEFLKLFEAQASLAALLGLILGIMMALDLGGPINKAAYIFAITTLSQSPAGTIAMAAVMAAGMSPPLGIAIANLIKKNLFTKDERLAAQSNWIMGASFITEGAIPFTAKNPRVLIIANICGSALAGLLVGALSITLAAPHGGIFVLALVRSNLFSTNSLAIGLGITFYLLIILLASLVSAFLIIFFNKWFEKRDHKKTKEIKKN